MLCQIFGIARVSQGCRIEVALEDQPYNDPQPDIVVLSQNFNTFKAIPKPDELTLIVEVSDPTLRFDLRTKANV